MPYTKRILIFSLMALNMHIKCMDEETLLLHDTDTPASITEPIAYEIKLTYQQQAAHCSVDKVTASIRDPQSSQDAPEMVKYHHIDTRKEQPDILNQGGTCTYSDPSKAGEINTILGQCAINPEDVHFATLSPGNKFLAVKYKNNKELLYNVAQKTSHQLKPSLPFIETPQPLHFAFDARNWFIAVTCNFVVNLYETEQGSCIKSIFPENFDSAHSMIGRDFFSPKYAYFTNYKLCIIARDKNKYPNPMHEYLTRLMIIRSICENPTPEERALFTDSSSIKHNVRKLLDPNYDHSNKKLRFFTALQQLCLECCSGGCD